MRCDVTKSRDLCAAPCSRRGREGVAGEVALQLHPLSSSTTSCSSGEGVTVIGREMELGKIGREREGWEREGRCYITKRESCSYE